MADEVYVAFCPRCDRMKFGLSPEAALQVVIEHVARVHPEYDPLWYREEEIHVP